MADTPAGIPAPTPAPRAQTAMEKLKVEFDPSKAKDLEKIFAAASKNKASDIHIKAGLKPIFRVNTSIHEVGNKPLSADDALRMILEILSPEQKETFIKTRDLDFAYTVPGIGRFRVNIFFERGTAAMAARRVNTHIPTFEELHLPSSIAKVTTLDQGLIMVAGPTGSGKSTTLACILDFINKNNRLHIITIEDPIEYLFDDKQSFINQREVGIDVTEFHTALRGMVRQDPDVILVGEMRDYISMEAALMASETGHLVFATIHASSASSTIGRMLELFPVERQPLIRQNLAFNLKAIFCQKMVPSCKEGVKMVPAMEIMFMSPTANKLVMAGEDKKLQELIRASEEEGMQDFNMALLQLINTGYITKRTGLEYSPNAEQLKMNLQGIFLSDDHRILG